MWRLAPRVDVTFVSFACFVAGDIWNRLFNGHSENDQEGIFTATFWPINQWSVYRRPSVNLLLFHAVSTRWQHDNRCHQSNLECAGTEESDSIMAPVNSGRSHIHAAVPLKIIHDVSWRRSSNIRFSHFIVHTAFFLSVVSFDTTLHANC